MSAAVANFAGYRNGRGPSPLPAASDEERGASADHQRFGCSLRFFFTVTLGRANVARHLTLVREPRKMPVVLSLDEIARLLEAAPGPKYKAALSAAYGAGLRRALPH